LATESSSNPVRPQLKSVSGERELVFGVTVAVVGGAAIPGQSLGIITLDPKSALVEVTHQ
jgi:hypothetical protein